jgi:hypothetical protein
MSGVVGLWLAIPRLISDMNPATTNTDRTPDFLRGWPAKNQISRESDAQQRCPWVGHFARTENPRH